MADTDTIAPALTPEQWARWWNNQGRAEIAVGSAARWMGLPDDPIPDNVARMVALANAALPGADTRKITRQDVAGLEDLISGVDSGTCVMLSRKLAALLPPE